VSMLDGVWFDFSPVGAAL